MLSGYYEFIPVILFGILSAAVGEGISWFLVYRTTSYQSLKSSIERLQAKIKKLKTEEETKKSEKKLKQAEDSLTSDNRAMMMFKMKSTVVLMFAAIGMIYYLNQWFGGRPILRLPFEPVFPFSSISHRGLDELPMTEASAIFLYVLSGLVARSNIKRYFGFEEPPMQNIFGLQPPEK
eukprot:TRINITY_DN26533_c0_g1_i1.p1 TRINITY_DN26533_c0_g1~~TRINITY_DN26533_c0_g1_i1.p1  ORF type:complete len:178 (-),score=32.13 TRINITY_DN26533_c0_g1_i1:71-604(-)